MSNKEYAKNSKKIDKDIIYVIIVIIFIISFIIKLPIIVSSTGGLTNLDSKIKIKNEYKNKGSFNMTYVSELYPNIYAWLYAKISPYADIEKLEDYLMENDNEKDMDSRSKMDLEESFDVATILGYQKSSSYVIINKEEIIVSYILKDAKTDLQVGDQIISINNEKVSSRENLKNIIDKIELNQKIEIEVINNNKTYKRYASKTIIEDLELIGFSYNVDYDITTKPEITIKKDSRESGPSGGLMLTLEIYNSLVKEDITKGYKIAGTGTINLDGVVGPIGGIKYKLRGAVKNKAKIFFAPAGENYEEAIKEKEKNNYKIDIVSVETIDDALEYLKKLEK